MSESDFYNVDGEGIERGFKLLLAAILAPEWYEKRVKKELKDGGEPDVNNKDRHDSVLKSHAFEYNTARTERERAQVYFVRCITFEQVTRQLNKYTIDYISKTCKKYAELLDFQKKTKSWNANKISAYQRDILALIFYTKKQYKGLNKLKEQERVIRKAKLNFDKMLMKKFGLTFFEFQALKNFTELEPEDLTIEERWAWVAERNKRKKNET